MLWELMSDGLSLLSRVGGEVNCHEWEGWGLKNVGKVWNNCCWGKKRRVREIGESHCTSAKRVPLRWKNINLYWSHAELFCDFSSGGRSRLGELTRTVNWKAATEEIIRLIYCGLLMRYKHGAETQGLSVKWKELMDWQDGALKTQKF